jgi:hypothetical protein
MNPGRVLGLVLAALTLLTAVGCGSSSSSSQSAPSSSAPSSSSTSGSSAASPGALSADAKSAATGDIPDNQIFLVFTDHRAGFSMKYPEGWTQSGADRSVTFSDKNNLVHVVIGGGVAPTTASVTAQLQSLKRSDSTLSFTQPRTLQLPSGPAVKSTYTTLSRPNPVTGKRVLLMVDRYAFGRGPRVAVVDLGTAKGVDNVDAYRMMIRSFRWL